jgi:PAS domain S-box-containing protein
MINRIVKILDVPSQDSEDARRKSMLNVLLIFIGACALLSAIILMASPSVLIGDGEPAARGLILSVVVAVLAPALYLVNRRVSSLPARLLFIFFFLAVLLLIYNPEQNLRGRGLLLFSLPIFLSSLLLISWASFAMAALSGLALAGLSYQTGRPLPSLLSFIDFFLVASVAWLASRSLERADREKERAREESRRNEARSREALDSIMEGCQIIGRDWKYLYLNDSAVRHARFPRNELLGRTMAEVYPWIEGSEMFAALRRCMHERVAQRMENEFTYPDGGRGWFELSIQPVPEGVFILSLDITERKRMEQAFSLLLDTQNQIARLDNLADIYQLVGEKIQALIGDGYVAVSMLDERVQALKIIGLYGFGDLYKKLVRRFKVDPSRIVYPLKDMTAEELRLFRSGKLEKIEGGLYAILTRKVPKTVCGLAERQLEISGIYTVGFICQHLHFGGLTILAKREIAPYQEMIETLMNLASISMNRIRAENALRESEDKFKYVFDNSAVGKSITLLSGEMHANKALCEMLGYSPEELQIKKWQGITFSDDVEVTQKEVDALLSGKKEAARFPKRYFHKNGSIVWADVSTSLRRDGQGKPLYLMTTLVDITARMQAEEALRQNEKRFRVLLENSADAISLLNANGTVTYDSPSYGRMLGYTSEERIGRNTLELVHPDDRENLSHLFAGILQKPGQVIVPPIRVRHTDGSWHWIEGIANNLLAEPSVQAIVVNFRDISERQRAEEGLRNSEARLRAILDATPFPIALVDVQDNNIGFWSHSALTLFGHTAPTTAGWYELAYPDPEYRREVIERWKPALEKARQSRQAVNTGAYRVTCRDGSVRICELYASFLMDKLIVTFNDITERRQAEEALRESETNFRTLAENAGEGVLIAGAGGVHRFANRAAAEITGYSVEELLHVNAKNLAHPDEAPRIMDGLEKRLAGENPPARYETAIVSKAGLKIPVEINSNKTVWEGRPADIVFVTDITERKRVEEALKNTMADLERSNRELEQFAYVASHDLQEPLRMVSSYTKLLGERYHGKLDKDADEFIGYAVDGASHMQRLINDLLAYSRVGTRGKPPESVPADSALDRALENLKFAIAEGNAEVTREPLPTVMVDDVQLSQVFQNLIANAIKFHGDDPPRISVACREHGPEWIFSVRDNGIGIDPQYLDRIFIIFQRLNPRGRYPGTGIGLAVCKKIILRHGGRIWAESESGKGSTFFFSLPKMEGK